MRLKYLSLLWIPLAVVLTYWNALGCDFVRWDDFEKVVNNPLVKSSGSLEGLKNIFTPGSYGAFQPLTNLTYALDYRIWGMNPMGFHLTNIVLFILGCLILERFLSSFYPHYPWIGFLVLLLAVHPINAEMVTWISGRKDILGFLFLSLSLLAYLNTMKTKSRKISVYIGPLLCFILIKSHFQIQLY